jgi:hypothetical protein
MPVPAGIRWPMMMFSFRPLSSSRAPRTAASVSTRVVSWKEAAEMKDSVVRLALVMPSRSGSDRAGFFPSCDRASCSRPRNSLRSTFSPSRSDGVARVGDAHLLEHLAHDHADVLVVDLHALEPVDLLDLVQQVLLNGPRPLDSRGCRAG